MSLLRPVIAGRLMRVTGPATRRLTPVSARYNSQTSSGTPLTKSDKSQPAYSTGESSMVNHEEANDGMIAHNAPDYSAEVDQASS
jgi:NADH dehydrogenase (ubiquinone) Fe-S protein 4